MSTWHQDQAMRRNPMPLWHETKYTAVFDPLGKVMTLSTFDTREEAERAVEGVPHGFVLLPGPGGRKG